jgi:hypothetical protein
MRADCYISVDVEADGPIPGPYSMISFGAAVAGTRTAEGFTAADPTATTFYRELRPISDDFDPAALAVSGLDGRPGAARGQPAVATAEFAAWVMASAGPARPVVVGYPACYDWMFLYWS